MGYGGGVVVGGGRCGVALRQEFRNFSEHLTQDTAETPRCPVRPPTSMRAADSPMNAFASRRG